MCFPLSFLFCSFSIPVSITQGIVTILALRQVSLFPPPNAGGFSYNLDATVFRRPAKTGQTVPSTLGWSTHRQMRGIRTFQGYGSLGLGEICPFRPQKCCTFQFSQPRLSFLLVTCANRSTGGRGSCDVSLWNSGWSSPLL